MRILISCFVVLLLSSCASMPNPLGKPLPSMTFSHLKPAVLDVSARDISVKPTDNQAEFSYPLDDMMLAYLERKIQTGGAAHTLVASLDKSSIVLRQKPPASPAIDFFGLGGSDVYDVNVALRLEHRDDAGELIYGTVVHARREISISEHASIAEREHAQFEGLEQLFITLDRYVDRVLSKDMALWVPVVR